jgi:hypothetical protein
LSIGGSDEISRSDSEPVGINSAGLHLAQLKTDNDVTYDRREPENNRKNTNPARPPRHGPFILGVFFIGIAAAAMTATFKGADYADERGAPWAWAIPVIAFVLTWAAAIQGVRLLA